MSDLNKLRRVLDHIEDQKLNRAIDFLQNTDKTFEQPKSSKSSGLAYYLIAIAAIAALLFVGINIALSRNISGTAFKNDKLTAIKPTEIETTMESSSEEADTSEEIESLEKNEDISAYSFSTERDLYSISISDERSINLAYDSYGRIRYLQDDIDLTHIYLYDNYNRISKEYIKLKKEDSLLQTVRYVYNSDGIHVTKYVNNQGGAENIIEMFFDENGNLSATCEGDIFTFYYYYGKAHIKAIFNRNGYCYINDENNEFIATMSIEENDSILQETNYDVIKRYVDDYVSTYALVIRESIDNCSFSTFSDGSTKMYRYNFGSIDNTNTLTVHKGTENYSYYYMNLTLFNPRQSLRIPIYENESLFLNSVGTMTPRYTDDQECRMEKLMFYETNGVKEYADFNFILQDASYQRIVSNIIETAAVGSFDPALADKPKSESEPVSINYTNNEKIEVIFNDCYYISEHEFCIEIGLTNKTSEELEVDVCVPYVNNVAYLDYVQNSIALLPGENMQYHSVVLENYTTVLAGNIVRENISFSNINMDLIIYRISKMDSPDVMEISIQRGQEIKDDRLSSEDKKNLLCDDEFCRVYLVSMDTLVSNLPEKNTVILKYYIENTSDYVMNYYSQNDTWAQNTELDVELSGYSLYTGFINPKMGIFMVVTLENVDFSRPLSYEMVLYEEALSHTGTLMNKIHITL